MKNRSIIILPVVLLALIAGYFLFSSSPPPVHTSDHAARTEESTIYHCPMHPQYTSDKPGSCPICGMDLVKADQPESSQQSEAAHESHAPVSGYAPVRVSPEQQTALGIVLEEARVMPLRREIRTPGRVAFDESRLFHIHTKFEAYIEELHVNFVGQQVKKGDPLFSVYSPELFSTENEYILALGGRRPAADGNISGSGMLSAARQRLELFDVGAEEIERLEKGGKASTRVTIRSPVSGSVMAMTARQGMRITPTDTVYDIADLSKVWVLADIYEIDLPFVHIGQSAQASFVAEPGKPREASVSYIDPVLEAKTRTVKARLELDNSAGDLKPGMFASVLIKSDMGSGLAVSDSAVLWTGERRLVFVQKDDGAFAPREVMTGIRAAGLYEVRQGLSAGEKVASGANFLLDSESRLKASSGGHAH